MYSDPINNVLATVYVPVLLLSPFLSVVSVVIFTYITSCISNRITLRAIWVALGSLLVLASIGVIGVLIMCKLEDIRHASFEFGIVFMSIPFGMTLYPLTLRLLKKTSKNEILGAWLNGAIAFIAALIVSITIDYVLFVLEIEIPLFNHP